MQAGLEIREERYDDPAARDLTEELQQDYVIRYGGRDRSPIDADEMTPPNGAFLVGYLDGRPVAMAGVRRHRGSVFEVRRMFVRPGCRGRGVSRRLLVALERRAGTLGATRIVLETGHPQPEAVDLYRSSGYQPIPPFGFYAESPTSIHLGKDLGGLDGLSE